MMNNGVSQTTLNALDVSGRAVEVELGAREVGKGRGVEMVGWREAKEKEARGVPTMGAEERPARGVVAVGGVVAGMEMGAGEEGVDSTGLATRTEGEGVGELTGAAVGCAATGEATGVGVASNGVYRPLLNVAIA
jgi:hypothetical protein